VLRFNDTHENETILANFINTSVIYPLSKNVIKTTIELCKHNKIKLPDAIIAATALIANFILVTRNIDDFKKIPKLELLNPFE
ncbi:MAG: PIN domain-containing protein, partial [Treponema sp.]|nr:PIN domain-containing protein [Treponema sp.]